LEQKDGIWNAAVSADGKTLATASNLYLRLWDLSTNPAKEKATLNIKGRSTALAFAPDGKTLFLGLGDHSLRFLDVTGPRITERMRLTDWPKNVWSVTHSPDGKSMAVGADDMTVWLYDATGDKPKEKNVLRIEKTNFGVKELFFTPDGRRLILGTGAGAVRLWDLADKEPKELAANNGKSDTFLLPMAYSPDGKMLAVARGKTVHLVDVVDDGFVEWMKLDKHTKGLRAVSFSPDGKLVASAGMDGQIVLWKVGLDKPILVKQRAGAFCEVLFVPQSKDVRVIACNWNSGTIYLFKVGK
jgi:WD40 repeat protein